MSQCVEVFHCVSACHPVCNVRIIVCMYVCMHVYVCNVHICVCMYVCVYVCVCMYVCIHVKNV